MVTRRGTALVAFGVAVRPEEFDRQVAKAAKAKAAKGEADSDRNLRGIGRRKQFDQIRIARVGKQQAHRLMFAAAGGLGELAVRLFQIEDGGNNAAV